MAIIPFRKPDGPRPDICKMKNRVLNGELLPPAGEMEKREIAGEHTSEPIKNPRDITRISEFLISNKRYRDNMLFILGINFGLRVSDLLSIMFCDLFEIQHNQHVFKRSFPILEAKTKNTRKVQRNRYVTINNAVMDAVELYLQHFSPKLDDFLFVSESNHANGALSRMSVDRILKGIGRDLDMPYKISTHTLRKTFAFHQMVKENNDPRRLLLLQKIFGHSSVAQTLDYIGITKDEIEQAYLDLNLGANVCLLDSRISEAS